MILFNNVYISYTNGKALPQAYCDSYAKMEKMLYMTRFIVSKHFLNITRMN